MSNRGGTNNRRQSAANAANAKLKKEQEVMNDNDMILCEYTHPNRGKHPVIGSSTRRNYGYRGKGDQFLVHVNDVTAQPHYFSKLEGRRPDEPAGIATPPPPPPPPNLAQPVAVRNDTSPPQVVQDKVLKVNLQLIPGVTPGVERALIQARMNTWAAIAAAGVEGLQDIKGIGEVRAQAIYKYVVGELDKKEEKQDDTD